MDNKIVWLLVVLVCGNLALTAYVALRPAAAVTGVTTAAVGDSVISEAKANDLGKEVVALYNKNDPVALYAKFDNLARVQITQQQITEKFQKLHVLLGDIDNFAYTGSELAGTSDGKAFYNVLYKVALSGKSFAHGTMKLTFVKEADQFGLVGIYINGSDTAVGH